ncbi:MULTISPECIES: DUF937 domain-containing protein [unclassified Bosea (in: a-proteobacteria)]|uniref:DUF937 domain-containing protein n=1 Tax=unclassified Bosea (in: a-proteobacteria) TaxID=2653178 RepID=UPI000F75F482|nr:MULTISPECIES: DUF937 domain-containing protein [unclassified Bosea (in: a-proteobacteria)]AZO78769.1 hypothetical protein BLM15_14900 [Bosea sp. Tri-49]RXT17443.1 hypothetical protein B5U98_25530 [Bosea sp. Tri-39]RXT40815.1 hypothetical protein B5U99_03400 [Bosea sp. Tri-54]
MMNLFEMMQSAQNGQAMQNLARQYGLSMQQTQSALDALLPAFSMGLQRQTQNPYAFGNLAQMMTATPFGQMYDSDGDGIPDRAMPLGQDVMSQLFGSKEVANAVAAQAAATSGVGQAILKQMLPVIASILMGGLFKSVNNQGLGGILGQFAEMMRGQMPGQQPQAPQANPANPLEAILGGLFGGQKPPAGQAQGSGPFGGGAMPGMPTDMGNIFGQILGGMFGGAQGQAPDTSAKPAPQSRRPVPEPESDEPPPSSETGPGSIGLDALNQMFEHGRQVQAGQQDALRSIFETMLGGGQRKA